jgi:hypothetical protein
MIFKLGRSAEVYKFNSNEYELQVIDKKNAGMRFSTYECRRHQQVLVFNHPYLIS